MKLLVSLVGILISFTATAAQNIYVYQALIPATQRSCVAEAEALAQRFSDITGAMVEAAQCVSAVNFPADETTYPMYSLAIRYRAESAIYPYSASIGKPDLFYSPKVPFYNSFKACLDDIDTQVQFFQEHTGLASVAATCEENRAYEPTYTLRIDGFDKSRSAKPKKSLFHFAPQFRAHVSNERFNAIGNLLNIQGAVIARQEQGNYAYYSVASARIHSDRLAGMPTQECLAQVEHANRMFVKGGARNALVWCLPQSDDNNEYSDLHVIHDASSSLSSDFGSSVPRSYSFQECLSYRELALSDARNEHVLGGICRPSALDTSGTYEVELFRKF